MFAVMKRSTVKALSVKLLWLVDLLWHVS